MTTAHGIAAHSGDAVRLVMRTPVVSLDRDATLREAATVLRDHDIGAVPVLGAEGLVGVLSESDLVQSLADGVDPDLAHIGDAMTPEPRPIDTDSPLWAAAMLMLQCGVRHLPVTDDGRVVGMLSIRDALAVLERERMVGPHNPIEAVNG